MLNHSQPPRTMDDLNLRLSTTLYNPNQPLTSGQRPLLFGVRRDLRRGTGGKCTLPTIRNWQTAQLTAPRQCLIQTNTARCMCHFDSAELPPQCLVELQFRDWLNIDTRIVQQRIIRCYDIEVCRLDRPQPDAFMQARTQACPAQRWQFHTPHAQPW